MYGIQCRDCGLQGGCECDLHPPAKVPADLPPTPIFTPDADMRAVAALLALAALVWLALTVWLVMRAT